MLNRPFMARQWARRALGNMITIAALLAVVMIATGCGSGSRIDDGSQEKLPAITPLPSSVELEAAQDQTCSDYPTAISIEGKGHALVADVRVCVAAPAGTKYWVIVKPATASGTDRGDYYPKGEVPDSAVLGLKSLPVPLGIGTEPKSSRRFFVLQVPVAGSDWMRKAMESDGDGKNDFDRSSPPAGCTIVSAFRNHTLTD